MQIVPVLAVLALVFLVLDILGKVPSWTWGLMLILAVFFVGYNGKL